eukprot:3092070-Amphidinium_carterae.1
MQSFWFGSLVGLVDVLYECLDDLSFYLLPKLYGLLSHSVVQMTTSSSRDAQATMRPTCYTHLERTAIATEMLTIAIPPKI